MWYRLPICVTTRDESAHVEIIVCENCSQMKKTCVFMEKNAVHVNIAWRLLTVSGCVQRMQEHIDRNYHRE